MRPELKDRTFRIDCGLRLIMKCRILVARGVNRPPIVEISEVRCRKRIVIGISFSSAETLCEIAKEQILGSSNAETRRIWRVVLRQLQRQGFPVVPFPVDPKEGDDL